MRGKLKEEIYEKGGNSIQEIPDVIEIDRENLDKILDKARDELLDALTTFEWCEVERIVKELFGDREKQVIKSNEVGTVSELGL